MSKQATLFQSWGGKKTKPPSQQPGTTTGGQGSNQGSDPVVDLCDEDDDDDYLLAMAMEQSLKEIEGQGPAQGCSSNIAKKSAKTTKENKPTKKKASTAKASSSTSAKPAAISSLFKSVGGVSSEKAKSVVNNDAGFEDIPDDEFDEEMGEMPDVSDLEDLPGFDKYAGRTWIYPTNYPVRAYQYSIVRQALYKNTMVVLPTGLGKTFIAAVVMYNFYRWYPQGKVIFMAPTKPLVAQQIEACYNIMGIPQGHTAEMTGAMPPADRQHAWTERRVFFLTPQVLTNDLSRSACPATEVKCVVVDEAHKALGNHAYCQVVRELVKHSPEFRVLALSATPGSDIKAVQQVFTNLLISHVELRSEDSDDIQKYTHERRVDKLVIPQGAELKAAQEKYLQVLNILVGRLKRQGVLYNRDAKSLSKFLILKAREAFRQNPPQNLQRPAYGAIEGDFALCMSLYHGYELLQLHGLRSLYNLSYNNAPISPSVPPMVPSRETLRCRPAYGAIEGDFALCMSLYHGYELLQLHGLRSLYNFLEGIMTGDKAQGRARTELLKNRDFCELMDELRGKFKAIKSLDPNASFRGPATQSNPVSLGHPKMAKLQEVVLEHFRKFEEANDTTRIMIFSQYRDSVNEITEMLSQHRPSIRVMSFVGQSSAGKSSRGFTQKEQLKVMARFRDGGFNTLVSTCVGEEGLDIGDVDLIICFDAHKSPIRLVQRMGRTGRKREGRIVMLVTEGKEEQIYNQSQYNKKSIHKAILNGARSLIYYAHNPRMVPDGLIPACHKMHISVTAKYQPKVKGQGQAKVKAAPRQSTASARRSSVRGPVAHDGFLTSTELHYWDQHYKIEDEGHTLPPSEFVTLRNKHKTPPVPPAQRSLSLTDWLPWQNELQDTQLVGHSQTTRDYVDLMAFMDRQGEIGPEEDNYSLEMEMYLNTEDVLKPGQRNIVTAGNHGILRFCSADTAKTGDSKKRTPPVVPSDDSDAEDFLNQGPRRSDLLPQFEDDVQLETESDDELPDGLDTVAIKKSTKTAKKPSTAAPKSKGKAGSRGKTKNKSVPAETPVEKPSVNKTEKKNPGFKDALQSFKFEERPSKDESVSTSKKRPSTESVISAIEEEDEDDFEVETEMSKDLKDRKRRSMESIAAAADWNDDENVDDFQELQPVELDDPNTEEEEEMHLEELLPIFNSRKDKEINSKSKGKKVKTPPPLEDLAEAFADLDKQGKISPVDMLDMMDDWGQTCSTRPSISDSVLAKFGEETSFCVRNVTDDDHKDDDLRNQVDRSQSPLPDGLDNGHPVPMDLEPRSVEKCKLRKLSKSNGVVKINPLKTSPLKMENSFSFLDVSKGSRISDLVSDNTNSTNCDNIGNSPLKKPSSRYSSESASEDRTKSESKMSSGCSQMDLDDFDDPFTLETASAIPETEKENSHSRNSSFSKPAESNEGKLFSAKPASRHVAFAPSLDTPIRVVPSSTSTPVIPLKPHQPQTLVCETPGFSPTAPKSSLKAGHQSFFDEDDSLFSHVFSFSHDLGQSVTKTPRPKPEMSQYTFTQALDCVDSGGNSGTSARMSDLSNEAGSEVKDLPSISSPQSVGSDRDSDSIIFTGRTTSQMKTNNGQEKKEDSKEKSLEESQEPQFDLGFDLDDFDDDIIPPSPEHVIRPASSQRFSVTMVTMSTSGVDANKSETNPVESKTVEKEKQSPFPHCSPPLAVTNKARPVAIVTPNSVPEEPESPPQPEGAASKVVWDPDAETMDVSAMDCEELEEPADIIEDEDEADESIIHAPRGRKKAAILVLSPESPKVPASKSFRATSNEGFKTPVLPAPRAGGQKRLRVSSEEDSPVSRPVAKKKVLMLDDDDDDDFVVPGKLGPGSSKPAVSKSDSRLVSKPPAKAKKPRPRSAGHGYLEVEAELSSDGAGSSDDEDGSDLDEYDASFVNDMTQLSQAATVDMRAVYMQSVRSPALRGPVGGSRASYGRHGNHDEDVFSQVPQQDAEYEEDSFCVGDDLEESEMVDDFHDDYEDTMMQEAIRQSLKSNNTAKPKVKATGSRRRVVRPESSSEDDSPVKAAGKVSKPTNISIGSSSKDSNRCGRTSPPMNDSVAVNPTCGSDTPVLSLKSRIQGRLKSVASDISHKPCAKPAQTNRSSAKTSSVSVSSDYSTDKSGNSSKSSTSLPTADQPTFSLGLDEFDMTDDEEDVFTDLPVPPKEAFKVPPQNPSPVKSDTSGSQPSPLVPFTSYNTSPGSTITTGSKVVSPPGGSAISREERLRISRLKQEEFKRKLEQQKKNRTSAGSLHDDGLPSNASINMSVSSLSGIAQMTRASSVSMATSATNSTANISMATKAGSISHASGNDFTKLKNKLIVLVSSKEINGAQDLVSSLRFQHNIQTVVKSMSHCDYIVSNRMAVERRVVSDFTNGSHKGALLERLRSLCEMFDRPCLIVERDRVKPGEDKGPGKTLLRSKYVEQTIASLGQTHVKLLFSESQDHSAELMAELCTQEHRKNTHITVTTELSTQQEQVLRFYLSLPKISYITALCLLHKFKSVAEFIKSPVSVLERRGQLPRTKAQDIHAYLRHPYDGQMVAVSKR